MFIINRQVMSEFVSENHALNDMRGVKPPEWMVKHDGWNERHMRRRGVVKYMSRPGVTWTGRVVSSSCHRCRRADLLHRRQMPGRRRPAQLASTTRPPPPPADQVQPIMTTWTRRIRFLDGVDWRSTTLDRVDRDAAAADTSSRYRYHPPPRACLWSSSPLSFRQLTL